MTVAHVCINYVCVFVGSYQRVRKITKIDPYVCNIYCFSTATIATRTLHSVPLYVQCISCSILRSIALHIQMFCVPCNV